MKSCMSFARAVVTIASLTAMAATPAILPAPAIAQGLFGGLAGDHCRAFQEAGGEFWQGFFRGRRMSPFLQDDGLYEIREYHCFRTEAECRDWLYDVQSRYETTSRTWCRQYFG